MEIEERICQIVGEVSGQKGIDRSDHLIDDLGMHDREIFEVICSLEDVFDLSIPDENGFATVADLILFVEANVHVTVGS